MSKSSSMNSSGSFGDILPFSTQDINSWYKESRDYKSLQECIKIYISTLRDVQNDLEAMIEPIGEYQHKTNCWKTVSTTTGVVSTSLTITGAALAPVTFGASLGLTVGGVAIGVAAMSTSIGVACKDHFKTKRYVEQINLILKQLEKPSIELDTMLKKMKQIISELIKLGYTEQEAITRTFLGVIKCVVDLGRVGQNAGVVALAIVNMPIAMVNVESMSNVAMASGQHFSTGSQLLSHVATKHSAMLISATKSGVISSGGNILKSTSHLWLNN